MFTIYSMDGCGYCQQVKKLMELTEQPHIVYTLEQDFSLSEFKSEFDSTTFPMVVHNDKVVGGAAEVAQYFKENNLV